MASTLANCMSNRIMRSLSTESILALSASSCAPSSSANRDDSSRFMPSRSRTAISSADRSLSIVACRASRSATRRSSASLSARSRDSASSLARRSSDSRLILARLSAYSFASASSSSSLPAVCFFPSSGLLPPPPFGPCATSAGPAFDVVVVDVASVVEDEVGDFPMTSEGRSSLFAVVVFFVSPKPLLPSVEPFSTSPDVAFVVVAAVVAVVAIAVTFSVAFCLPPSPERRFSTTASEEERASSFFGSSRGRSSPPFLSSSSSS